MISLIHIIDTKNNKLKYNTNLYKLHYHIQYINDVQDKNFDMTWYFRKFPRHPVAETIFKMRGRNTIILNYHYRVDPKIGKYFCKIRLIPCACPSCVAQLDKYWLPNCDTSSQPMCYRVENCYYNKIF